MRRWPAEPRAASTATAPGSPARRALLASTCIGLAGVAGFAGLVLWPQPALADERVSALLREGGVAIAFRHAYAPGTFDPPGFQLEQCSTQRNLNDEGRAQARRLGAWFRSQGLVPAQVRSSPWCRCLDTASLAFGRVESWAALSSPVGRDGDERARQVKLLREALGQIPAGRFEAWVTHQFVLQDLAGVSTSPAEALVVRAGRDGAEVVARATLY